MDCLSIKKGCEKKSEEESNVRSLAGGQRGELLFLIKGGRCFCRVSVGPCTWHWLACINKVRTVFCSDVRQTRMLATQPICYLTSLCVLPEEKFAPNFRACIIVKNQYFYGWKKKYPPLKDVQLEKEKEKKKHFVHHSWCLMKTWTHLRNVPFTCKLYLYLFALFSLLYFVCTHSITTKCYIKNMNNKTVVRVWWIDLYKMRILFHFYIVLYFLTLCPL